jgi:hypothetical protein
VKTDASGVKLWDKTFGGSLAEQLFSVQQTTDGGYFLGGYSESGISGDKTQVSFGGADFWIIKTDANGVKHGMLPLGGSADDNLRAAQQTMGWRIYPCR